MQPTAKAAAAASAARSSLEVLNSSSSAEQQEQTPGFGRPGHLNPIRSPKSDFKDFCPGDLHPTYAG